MLSYQQQNYYTENPGEIGSEIRRLQDLVFEINLDIMRAEAALLEHMDYPVLPLDMWPQEERRVRNVRENIIQLQRIASQN